MKFCKDCVFYAGPPLYEATICHHSNALHSVAMVSGVETYKDAQLMRCDEDKCGKEAKWFERKVSILERIRNYFDMRKV